MLSIGKVLHWKDSYVVRLHNIVLVRFHQEGFCVCNVFILSNLVREVVKQIFVLLDTKEFFINVKRTIHL